MHTHTDQGYAELWWSPQQDARPVRALWPACVPRAKEHVRLVRLPRGQEADVQLGPEGQAPQDDGHWPYAAPQVGAPPVQERLPLWDRGRGQEGGDRVSAGEGGEGLFLTACAIQSDLPCMGCGLLYMGQRGEVRDAQSTTTTHALAGTHTQTHARGRTTTRGETKKRDGRLCSTTIGKV
jgi:hypothetical protein